MKRAALLRKYKRELLHLYVGGPYNPTFFILQYGKERGARLCRRAQKAQDKRIAFLDKRIKELEHE